MLILLLIVMGVAISGLAWLSGAYFVCIGLRRKSKWNALVGGAFLVASTFSGLWCAGILLRGGVSTSSPTQAYADAFGAVPSPDVSDIRSHGYSLGDTGITFLKFKAAPTTIRRLTAKGWARLSEQEREMEDFSSPSTERPAWWKPQKTRTTAIYKAEKRFGTFSSEREILSYDAATRQAFYSYSGVD